MKIKEEFKKYCLEVAETVINRFYKKEFENGDQEKLNYDATIIKVAIKKADEALNQIQNNSPIELSAGTMIYAIGKNSIFFQLSFSYFQQEIPVNRITYERILDDWVLEKEKRDSKEGLDKYLNSSDPHFNHNAYYWRIEINTKQLFDDLEIPFEILSEYLKFKFKYNRPIAVVDGIENLMNKHDLNKDQRLFIYDKLNGLIANTDIETQNRLSILNIEILDRRWTIEPYDLEEENKKFNIDHILEESKENSSIEDQISFLRRKQLQLNSEKDETGFIQELINSIQIEIDSLYLKLNRNNSENKFQNDLKSIKENQQTMMSSLENIESELHKFKIANKAQIEKLQEAIDKDFEKLFVSDSEQQQLLEKLNTIAKNENNQEWFDQPLKTKLKVMLPLVIFKYERELDISNFKFPKNLIELKRIFTNEKS